MNLCCTKAQINRTAFGKLGKTYCYIPVFTLFPPGVMEFSSQKIFSTFRGSLKIEPTFFFIILHKVWENTNMKNMFHLRFKALWCSACMSWSHTVPLKPVVYRLSLKASPLSVTVIIFFKDCTLQTSDMKLFFPI